MSTPVPVEPYDVEIVVLRAKAQDADPIGWVTLNGHRVDGFGAAALREVPDYDPVFASNGMSRLTRQEWEITLRVIPAAVEFGHPHAAATITIPKIEDPHPCVLVFPEVDHTVTLHVVNRAGEPPAAINVSLDRGQVLALIADLAAKARLV